MALILLQFGLPIFAIAFSAERAHAAARERGRSGIAWIFVVVTAGVWGFLAAWFFAASLSGYAEENALVAALAAPLCAIAGAVLSLMTLNRLPVGPARLSGRRWPVYRLGQGKTAGGKGAFALVEGGLTLTPGPEGGPLAVAFDQLDLVTVNGECVKLRFGERQLLLQPSGESAGRRTSLSLALARHIDLARRSAEQRP